MNTHQLPGLPFHVRASDLIHGNDADFVINAYIALQHHWPDSGGYAHYLYYLSQRPGERLQVLIEIAASKVARRIGTKLISDLPEDFVFGPEKSDPARLGEAMLTLRLTQAVIDAQSMRQIASTLTVDALSVALETVVQSQQADLAVIESRTNDLAAAVRALEQQLRQGADGAQREQATDVGERSAGSELQRLVRRVEALEQRQATRQEVDALRHDVSGLKNALTELHRYATVDVKREVAEFFNALSSAARPIHAVNDSNIALPLASHA